MRKSSGYVLIDSIIGLFCMAVLVSVVHGLCSIRKAFVYDPQCVEMKTLWENSAYMDIYVPQKPQIEEEPPAEPALPS